MRTLKTLAVAMVLAAALCGTLAFVSPTPALANPPTSDPNCKHPCSPFKKHGGFTCTFAGCTTDGVCLYAC